MIGTAQTFTLTGLDARPVRVEADVHRGLPSFSVVGLPDAAVRELRERVRAALLNGGFEFPLRRVVVNLAPASLRKTGPGLDLAVAIALLQASGQFELPSSQRFAMVGELALDASLRAVAGILPIAEAACRGGVEALIVAEENGPEAALASREIEVIPLSRLEQLHAVAAGERAAPAPLPLSLEPRFGEQVPDLADLRGSAQVRHALEVAAAGGHSLLMFGAPGAGKSLAASRMPSILPPLNEEQALEVARIASACGRLGSEGVRGRPFRAPHHTISQSGLLGGGTPLLPGEVTLAHRGVLFLDDLADFRRDALEALCDALKTGEVSVARGSEQGRFPARFQLIAAASPCPCGCEDDCRCAPLAVRHYKGRVFAALRERIHLVVELHRPTAAEIAGPPGESSEEVRGRVCAAREHQEERLGAGRSNAEMTVEEARACELTVGASRALADACSRRALSPPAYRRTVSVARTVADLQGAEAIGCAHLAHALDLSRRRDRR
jgi:magnesium chelatase family protein